MEYRGQDGEGFFDAAQNARLVASAERYYRVMYYGAAESWNLRDRHMFETLEQLLAWHGENSKGQDSKAIVWAHNSHVGNAAATDMGLVRGEINIGQLCREQFGHEAVLIGFGTDRGTVAAASDWDGPMEIKQVRPAHRDSYERLCRDSGVDRFLADLPGSALARAAQRTCLPAPGAGDRRDLPAGDRARQPLFRCLAAAAVRRLSLVHRDPRGDAAADNRSTRGRAGNLSIRALSGVRTNGGACTEEPAQARP